MIDSAYLEKINKQITDLETTLSDPAVSRDRKKFQELLTEHTRQKKIREGVEAFVHAQQQAADNREMLADENLDEELAEMARNDLAEVEALLPGLEKAMMVSLLPPSPLEESNTIVEIRAGTGGDEAALFAGDLLRMYNRFAENQGWKVEVIDTSPSEIGGYKEVIFSIEGEGVYRQMQYESGVHRVQRIPETEASGRIHTSAATVAVLPEAEEVELKIAPEEIRVDVFRSSGPGGQSVNTTDSAIRLTHLPTGLIVQCQDEKSQHRNKDKAMRVLRARLMDLKQQEEQSRMASERKSQIGSGDRSERIRTYNYPQNRVTDHRINLTLYHLDRIMEGDITELTTALHDNDVELRLHEELETLAQSDES